MGISAKDVKELRERTDAPMMECKAALEAAGGDMEAAIKVLRERGIAKMAKRAGRETAEGVVRVRIGPGNQGGTAVMLTCETDFSARSESFQKLADAVVEAAAALPAEGASPEAVLAGRGPEGASVKELFEKTANTIRENMTLRQVIRFPGTCGAYVHFDGRCAALVEVDAGGGGGARGESLAGILRELCMHVVAFKPPPLAVDAAGISPELVEQEKEIFIKQAMDSGKPKEIAEKMVAGRMKKFLSERALLEQPFVKDPNQTVAAFLSSTSGAAGVERLKVVRFSRLQIGE